LLREVFISAWLQGPELDFANFKHNSARHASLGCNSCHQRTDNSALPRFPGHDACTGCHLAQFVTPNVPLCGVCHADVNSAKPPLQSFPSKFNESFNVKFDHAQHMTGAARPQNGCAACHSRTGGRSAALAIPNSIAAHNQCYSCHTPGSKSAAGKEIGSCGVCHDQKSYARTPANARAFRFAFSHAKHGAGQRLACTDCHQLTAGAAQTRQVSSPGVAEHFPATRGQTCFSCHNGKRSFGGDLDFKDCRRCHTAASFKMPL
jgi:c(7)-type cytochrome triheme protein